FPSAFVHRREACGRTKSFAAPLPNGRISPTPPCFARPRRALRTRLPPARRVVVMARRAFLSAWVGAGLLALAPALRADEPPPAPGPPRRRPKPPARRRAAQSFPGGRPPPGGGRPPPPPPGPKSRGPPGAPPRPPP